MGCAFEVAFMRPSWTVMDINFFVPSTKETETHSASHLPTNHAAEDCARRFPDELQKVAVNCFAPSFIFWKTNISFLLLQFFPF